MLASAFLVLWAAIIYLGEIKLVCWSVSISWSEETEPEGDDGSDVVKDYTCLVPLPAGLSFFL